MIRIEPDTNGQVLFTNEQFMTAANIIRLNPNRHFDIVEERFKQDSATWARLMLWYWPESRDQYPVRSWIEPSGHASLTEDCTWITPEEWPAWALTEQETSND